MYVIAETLTFLWHCCLIIEVTASAKGPELGKIWGETCLTFTVQFESWRLLLCVYRMLGVCHYLQGRRYRGGQGGLEPPHFQKQGG